MPARSRSATGRTDPGFEQLDAAVRRRADVVVRRTRPCSADELATLTRRRVSDGAAGCSAAGAGAAASGVGDTVVGAGAVVSVAGVVAAGAGAGSVAGAGGGSFAGAAGCAATGAQSPTAMAAISQRRSSRCAALSRRSGST